MTQLRLNGIASDGKHVLCSSLSFSSAASKLPSGQSKKTGDFTKSSSSTDPDQNCTSHSINPSRLADSIGSSPPASTKDQGPGDVPPRNRRAKTLSGSHNNSGFDRKLLGFKKRVIRLFDPNDPTCTSDPDFEWRAKGCPERSSKTALEATTIRQAYDPGSQLYGPPCDPTPTLLQSEQKLVFQQGFPKKPEENSRQFSVQVWIHTWTQNLDSVYSPKQDLYLMNN